MKKYGQVSNQSTVAAKRPMKVTKHVEEEVDYEAGGSPGYSPSKSIS